MKNILEMIQEILENNHETISINALIEVCRIYSIYEKDKIIEIFKNKNLINLNSNSIHLPHNLQIAFLKRAKMGDLFARETLIITNYHLVIKLVNCFFLPDKEKEDFIQYGILGLMHAIDHFDFDKQNHFSTYAVNCIKGKMKHYLPSHQNSLKIDPSIFYLASKILNIEEQLMKKLNKEIITDLEILEELKKLNNYKTLTEEDVFFARQYCKNKISLDKEIIDEEGEEINLIKDNLASESENVEEEVIGKVFREMIEKILNGEIKCILNQQELLVIRYIYGFDEEGIPRTCTEAAKILKISGSRVREIHINALRKLRKIELLRDTEKTEKKL